ncbi:AraC family transcriptional regulator [Streptomyces sp. NBC_00199]|uniref:AraC family transcriptional regulator n=1 Tax=Streptomyces sp. NBC_00199 TaxID=2975678 RepID=UPI002B1E23EB|nr:AraC family transcriptional regulator [Streptomyces sp. NBC_00199]
MLESPSFIRLRLDYAPGVDVLSDVIAVARTGRPRSALVRWHAPWGQRFASVPGSAGFQVVVEGSCHRTSSAGEGTVLRTGDVLFLPHGNGHTLGDTPASAPTAPACEATDSRFAEPFTTDRIRPPRGDGPVTSVLCGAYQLEPSRTHPLLRGLPEFIHLPAHAGRRPELDPAVHLLAHELEHRRPGTDSAVPALLDLLILYILREWFAQEPARQTTTGWAAALNDPTITAALNAMHRDPAAPWTVAALANEAGRSRAAFARRFTDLVGQPPLGYLTWWRMTTAARLLKTTDAPLRTVANQVGYASEFAFANAFKRTHHTAPGKFRAQNDQAT